MYLLCLDRIDETEPSKGYEVAPKVNTMKRHCCTGEAPGEEVAPWNSSTVGDPPLSEDHGTLHPQGSLCVVNKIHALHVEDVEDTLYQI